MFEYGSQVMHPSFGVGTVELDRGTVVIVRFSHGLEVVEPGELEARLSAFQALEQSRFSPSLLVVSKVQALCIQAIQDQWGVFSRSKIALLPHQLWVCRKVLEQWPTRWLVADDVGLGKTVEAGLILWPAIAKGLARRILILCPASLVEQWHERLKGMFDLRFMPYLPEMDRPGGDFWDTHPYVVASLQTLRDNKAKRHERMLEAEPWDLVLVDEAHHLNADEQSGATLGYRLVSKLNDHHKIKSMVFFTGTPHRGKDYGFLALLKLLKPEEFEPARPLSSQLPKLKGVMIRNNKQNVTDLKGVKLFKPPVVRSVTYAYSDPEREFYDTLTEFICTGKAYASTVGQSGGQTIMLVLITMQKLASSSVAAIRKALERRLERLPAEQHPVRRSRASVLPLDDLEEEDVLLEDLSDVPPEVILMEDEERWLRQLLHLARQVTVETKITRILDALTSDFQGRTVLFFTEYKATQALLMGALMEHFGEGSVAFINGEGRAEGVQGKTLFMTRTQAAEQFNTGQVRFLVSTEAAGEGIDLQKNCHTLVHVDLPWNPMRLHQRVGRLNRYGQQKQVDVLTLRNPETVESRIWDKLNEKIRSIMRAFGSAMDEPEDLLELVLGMTRPSFFSEIFSEAILVKEDSLGQWFDAKTSRFGGEGAVDVVQQLVGNSARFDFGEIEGNFPQFDLPDLMPFMRNLLTWNRRQIREEESGWSFKTPDLWLDPPGLQSRYDDLHFTRTAPEARQVLGFGHTLLHRALDQATEAEASVGVLEDSLEHPLLVFRVQDELTGQQRTAPFRILGVELQASPTLLSDTEVLSRVNLLPSRTLKRELGAAGANGHLVLTRLNEALDLVKTQDFPFGRPIVELVAVLLPATSNDRKDAP